ncbi:solute carrier family 25 member 16-like [Mytilus galloprovincialis]|uniref:solute carrier family 25 member 16-like n=1 Tax=Mytilus galloprovincialis TaxID=29158 RepID=UPI003F7B682E
MTKTAQAALPDLQTTAMKTDSRREMKEKGKNFIAGGVAGCCAKSLVAPLDRIKILLQAHNHHYKDLGVWSTLLKVKLKENISGLYKGNGIHMIRVFPYAGVQFMAYEKSKEIVKTYLQNYPQIGKFLAGSMAGISAVSITYPLDIIRARIAFQVTGDHLCIGLTETAGCIIKQDGIMGLYRGMTPTLLGMIPYAGTTFFSFETLKGMCVDYFPDLFGKPCPQDTGGIVLTIPGKSLCGGLAGLIGQTVSYPFDVVKRKIQLSEMLPESHKYNVRWYRIFFIVYKEHGISKGLYRGMSINYIRIIPMQATVFTVYEQLKQWMGMDTCITR